MRHNFIGETDESWSCSTNGLAEVLVQLMDAEAQQVRVKMPPEEAEIMGRALLQMAAKARSEEAYATRMRSMVEILRQGKEAPADAPDLAGIPSSGEKV